MADKQNPCDVHFARNQKKKGTFESNEKFIDVRVGEKRKITYARR